MYRWTNTNNIAFYNNMPLEKFREGVIEGGLDNNCDICAIDNYIKHADKILEVGAGYGRVLDHIISNGYDVDLYAVERNPVLYALLRSKYQNQANIIHSDIRKFKDPQHKFDLILWMWASICEFAKDEQLAVLHNLINHLERGGYLIFDSIPTDCKTIKAVKFDQNNCVIRTEFGNNYLYLPSYDEIIYYTERLGVYLAKVLVYKTRTLKERNLYVLCNTN